MAQINVYTIEVGNPPQLSIEKLVVAEAFLGLLKNQIEANEREIPEALTMDLREVSEELDRRLRNEKERKYQALLLRKEQLTPIDERRQKIDKELESLGQELGKVASKPAPVAVKSTRKK